MHHRLMNEKWMLISVLKQTTRSTYLICDLASFFHRLRHSFPEFLPHFQFSPLVSSGVICFGSYNYLGAATDSTRTCFLPTYDFSVPAARGPPTWNVFCQHSCGCHHDSFNFVFVFRDALHWKRGERRCLSVALHDYSHKNQLQLRGLPWRVGFRSGIRRRRIRLGAAMR